MYIIKTTRTRTTRIAASLGYKPTKNMDFVDFFRSGLQSEDDVDDSMREQVSKTHPFLRPTMQGKVPKFIRWMWHPKSGKMLADTSESQQHAMMHLNHSQGLKSKQNPAGAEPFDQWVRGYYIPEQGTGKKKKPHHLAIRPYGNDDNYDQNLSWDLQFHARDMIQNHMGKTFEKDQFTPDINNNWLMDNLGKNRRW